MPDPESPMPLEPLPEDGDSADPEAALLEDFEKRSRRLREQEMQEEQRRTFEDRPIGAAELQAYKQQMRQRGEEHAFTGLKEDYEPQEILPPSLEHVGPIRDALQREAGDTISFPAIAGVAAQVRKQLEQHVHLPPQKALQKVRDWVWETYRTIKRHKQYGDALFEAGKGQNSVLECTVDMARVGANSIDYAQAFVQAAALQSRHAMRKIDAMAPLSLPGEMQILKGRETASSNHLFLARNTFRNWLRLIGCLKEIDYDELHYRGMYLFTTNTIPTQFAHAVAGYRNGSSNDITLVRGKNIMEIGPGNGADVQLFLEEGANSVDVVEGSPGMVLQLAMRRRELPPDLQQKYILPREAQDMFDALRDYRQDRKTFDTVSAHSCTHYFDDRRVRELHELIHGRIRSGGHYAFAVKAPGATLDGNGILLYEDVEQVQGKRAGRTLQPKELVHNRMWMNYDGQMRSFRSPDEWKKLLEPWFVVVQVSDTDVDNYEAPGKTQKFYNFICRRRELEEQPAPMA